MSNTTFLRWTGISLSCGGILTVLINVILTPQLPLHASTADTAALPVFLWRQGASALAVLCILFGTIGVYLWQAPRAGRFGAFAFILAFIGTALALTIEWNEVFMVRELALNTPDALRAMDARKGLNLYDLGTLISLSAFELGWIVLAASTLRVKRSRWGAWGVIAGFVLIPFLTAVFQFTGAIVGNIVLGSAWFWLGNELRRNPTAD